MSMEHGVSASTTKTSHGAQAAGGHGYGKSPAGAPGGFASLLSDLGAEDETVGQGFFGLDVTEPALTEGVDLATDDKAGQGLPGLGVGTDGLATQVQGEVDPAQTAAAAAAALAVLGLDLAGMPAQGDVAGSSAATLAALAAAGGTTALAGQPGTPRASSEADVVTTTSTVGLVGARAGAAQMELTDAKGVASSLKEALSGKPESAALAVDGLGVQRQVAQRNQSTRVDAAKVDALRGGKGEDVAARLGWRSEAATQATQAAMAAGGQQPTFTQGELGGGRFGSGPGERGEEGARVILNEFAAVGVATTASTGSASLDPAQFTLTNGTPDGGMTPEMDVAEQVSYWVGRGARDAEISVEGLAENPIHITIAMQGQEARVMFRAEQAETRQVLEDAVPHLRELLEREGLALADVSVGHSNPGWNGGSEASAQAREQAANRVRLGSLGGQRQGDDAGPLAQGAVRATPLPAGRTLDLFV